LALIDEIKGICSRLSSHGWRDLLLQHDLDIAAEDLKKELLKELPSINRQIEGFEDFAIEGKRGIEAGNPSRSLLFHALASPNVIKKDNRQDLDAFPTLVEIEKVENFVYAIQPPSLQQLRNKAKEIVRLVNEQRSDNNLEEAAMAVVVFSSEYRPAAETVHQKHADICYSRTGVARVGTDEPLYDNRRRGFLPTVNNKHNAFRVLPARYAAYIAIQLTGNKDIFGPLHYKLNHDSNAESKFWVPLHKLFSGNECLRDTNLNVDLRAFHINEKIKRIHLALQKITNYPKINDTTLNNPPYTFSEAIAEFSTNVEYGDGLLVPLSHSPMVEPARDNGKRLTFLVPPARGNESIFSYFNSSLGLEQGEGIPGAPEYIHVRHKVENETILNLNLEDNMMAQIRAGGYQAQHYHDFTGDGWIEASIPELISQEETSIPQNKFNMISAYSLVTAPDFFTNVDQGELRRWYDKLDSNLQYPRWLGKLETLSDQEYPPNLELKSIKDGNDKRIFNRHDKTATAIVSLPLKRIERQVPDSLSKTMRHSYLPDAASGVFAPGWDIGRDKSRGDDNDKSHLASYTLGSPFPEDSKLCAAISAFWPAVAPDAGRSFWWEHIPGGDNLKGVYPTRSPLTDEEIGSVGDRGWDGFSGPQLISDTETSEIIEYHASEYVDYVESALENKFSLNLTINVDNDEYQKRIKAMSRAYLACGVPDEESQFLSPVLSFGKVSLDDLQLREAQERFGNPLNGDIFRIEIVTGQQEIKVQKVRLKISQKFVCFVGNDNIVLVKENNKQWEDKVIE
jgi:hypothetical protein